jgi:hypothetical protein
MSTVPEPLDAVCTPEGAHTLAAAGLVDRAAALRMLAAGPPAEVWRKWADVGLLYGGTALLGAAAIYLVAFNWAALGKFGQGGLLAAALLLAGAAATLRLGTPIGTAALVFAQVLVGALFAWFGQTYQTGADPYSLFLAWALLTLPWAIVGGSSALWLAQGLLWNTALALYSAQVLALDHEVLHLLTATSLAFWAASARSGPRWLAATWLGMTLAYHAGGTIWWVYIERTATSVAPSVGLAAAVAVAAGRIGRGDAGARTLVAVGLFVELCLIEARVLYEVGDRLDAEFFLGSLLFAVASALALGQGLGLSAAVRRWNRHVDGQAR